MCLFFAGTLLPKVWFLHLLLRNPQDQLPRPALFLLSTPPPRGCLALQGFQKARAQEVPHLDLEERILGTVANVTGSDKVHTWKENEWIMTGTNSSSQNMGSQLGTE